MAKSFLFRSLSDEIRRYWLTRPPQRRTVLHVEEFSSDMWALGLCAGSSFARHEVQVMAAIGPLLQVSSDQVADFRA